MIYNYAPATEVIKQDVEEPVKKKGKKVDSPIKKQTTVGGSPTKKQEAAIKVAKVADEVPQRDNFFTKMDHRNIDRWAQYNEWVEKEYKKTKSMGAHGKNSEN